MTDNEHRRGGGRPLTRRVAYGFLALDPACAQDGDWRVQVQRVFRLQHLLMWPLRGSRVVIESLRVGSEHQLMAEVPASLFEPDISPSYAADHFFDPPVDAQPLIRFIGAPCARRFEIDLGQTYGVPTLEVGGQIVTTFRGKLRGLLLIGDEVV